MAFDKNFLWGAAIAAPQVEGAYNEDGKVETIWDSFAVKHNKHGENSFTACDHYHRFEEDIALMKEIGLKSYRFSISWGRIISDVNGTINVKGLTFYKKLVSQLLANGIEPLCTLYHWDLPMWAHELGGWKNESIINWFSHYVNTVVKELPEIKYWFTFNEPQCFVGLGYYKGEHSPFEKNSLDVVAKISRNVMLAHGEAVKVIRELNKNAKISLALANSVFTPVSDKSSDIEAARVKIFDVDDPTAIVWWSDSIFLGKFPKEMEPLITKADKEIICQPLDFYSFNAYSAAEDVDGMQYNGCPITSMGWRVTPEVLYWTTKFLYERYNKPMMISENGMTNCDWIMSDGKVHDLQRIDYIKKYLGCLKRAVDEGIPVLGYQYWSIMDNFEWTCGYDSRFGLIYIDYETQKRTLKDSAYYYAEIIKSNGENL